MPSPPTPIIRIENDLAEIVTRRLSTKIDKIYLICQKTWPSGGVANRRSHTFP